MCLKGSLKVEHLVPTLPVIDEKLFSWRLSRLLHTLPHIICLWLERMIVDFGAQLLAPRLSQHVLLLLTFLETASV